MGDLVIKEPEEIDYFKYLIPKEQVGMHSMNKPYSFDKP
jgi:hypothetical protein